MRLSDPIATQLEDLRTWLVQTAETYKAGPPSAEQNNELNLEMRERAVFLEQFVIGKTVVRDVDGTPRADVLRRVSRRFDDVAPEPESEQPAAPSFVAQVTRNGA